MQVPGRSATFFRVNGIVVSVSQKRAVINPDSGVVYLRIMGTVGDDAADLGVAGNIDMYKAS